jgi:hypothetical protein
VGDVRDGFRANRCCRQVNVLVQSNCFLFIFDFLACCSPFFFSPDELKIRRAFLLCSVFDTVRFSSVVSIQSTIFARRYDVVLFTLESVVSAFPAADMRAYVIHIIILLSDERLVPIETTPTHSTTPETQSLLACPFSIFLTTLTSSLFS